MLSYYERKVEMFLMGNHAAERDDRADAEQPICGGLCFDGLGAFAEIVSFTNRKPAADGPSSVKPAFVLPDLLHFHSEAAFSLAPVTSVKVIS